MNNPQLTDVTELSYRDLTRQMNDLRSSIVTNTLRSSDSQIAGGLAGLTLALLPLVHNTPGDLYYATDGCKPGEAVGHGTGCAVFWNAATVSWLRVGDYSSPSGPSGTPLGVALGGTGADLSGSGGANQYVKQLSLGGVFSAGIIADADLPATMSGKTLVTPTIASFTNAQHTHQNAAGGGLLDAAAINSGVFNNARINFAAPDPIGGTTPNSVATSGLTVTHDATTNPSQIVVRGSSNNNQQLLIGYNTTSDYGSIEALIQGTGFKPMVLCGGGGSLGVGAVFSPGEQIEVGGNVKFNHLVGRTTAPTAAVGAAAGTGPSIVSPVNGTDMAGIIDVTTGTATLANGVLCKLTFSVAYGAAPRVVLFAANGNAADVITGASSVFVTTTANDFSINTGTVAPTISKQYQWYYIIAQ